MCLPSDRGEHGRVPAGDVHRGGAAGSDAVAAQEAEGERVPLCWDMSQHEPTGHRLAVLCSTQCLAQDCRPKAVYYLLLPFL